jgi:hypothetical protein
MATMAVYQQVITLDICSGAPSAKPNKPLLFGDALNWHSHEKVIEMVHLNHRLPVGPN